MTYKAAFKKPRPKETLREYKCTDKEQSTESLDEEGSLMRGFKIVQNLSCHTQGSVSNGSGEQNQYAEGE